MPMKTMVYVAAIPWACGIIGYVGGGNISDFLYKRMHDKLLARKIVTSVPLALSIVALLALCVSSGAVPAVVLICLIVVCMTAAAQACWATVTELVPPERVGGASGFVHLLSNISGIIGPAATGFAVQYFGGFDTAFLLAAVIAFLGTVAMVLFVKSQPVRQGAMALAKQGAAD
jgi:predicted MFS family arabinose efflux permease